MKTGFIFSAGSFYGLHKAPQPEDLIIAADAGLLLCQQLKLKPDYIIGDFDSVSGKDFAPASGKDFASVSGNDFAPASGKDFDSSVTSNSEAESSNLTEKILRYPVEKDDTDTMLAIKKSLELGCEEIYIYGGTGGKRMDHTLANIAALGYANSMGCKAYLYDDNFIFTVMSSEKVVIKKTIEDGLISVFAFGGDAAGVSIQGTQYTLDNAALCSNFPLGVSNHMRDDLAVISCTKGSLLVGWQLA